MGYLVATKSGTQSVAEMIDSAAMESAKKGDALGTYGYAFLGTAWNYFGAEGVSQIAAHGSQAADGSYLSAGLEVATLGKGKYFTYNPCKCFVAGTMIYTKRGLVPIEKIQVGDWVAARSDETSETAYKQVVRLVRNGEKEIIRLRYRLPNGKTEVLGVTEEHPFMLEGRHWVNAGALKPDDKIMRLAGGVLTVQSMHHEIIKQHTFNFEVEGFHTYFAGVGGAWVHNSGPCEFIAKFSNDIKTALRKEATDIWQSLAGRRAIWDGLQVHHRIPLEWAHLFPKADPNRVANLIGLDPKIHTQVTNAWNAWSRSLGSQIPSQADIVKQAMVIDRTFSSHFVYPK